MIVEEVCQGLFLARTIVKLISTGREEILWNLFDLIITILTFVAYNI